MSLGPSKIVEGYVDGLPVQLELAEIECGHWARSDLVHQIQNALAAARAMHFYVSIHSSWRSMAEQTELHEGWMLKKPGYKPANRPGYSAHQSGTAVDLAFGSAQEREEFAAISEAHGASRPHTGERWHFEFARIPELPVEEITKSERTNPND